MADTAIDAIKFLRAAAIAAETDLDERIYMSIAPQSAEYPLAVMEIISRTETPTQDSGSAVDTYRIQVDVYARADGSRSGFEQASIVSNALREAWSRQSNFEDYANGIDSVQEVNYFTDYVPDLNVFRVSNDYMVRVVPAYEEMASVRTKTVELTSANIKSMFDTPITVLTGEAGKVISVIKVITSFEYGTIQYTGGGAVIFRDTITTNAVASTLISSSSIQGAADVITMNAGLNPTNPLAIASGADVVITNASAAFAAGDGTLKLIITYQSITI